jgi:hypothetical protein
MAGRGGLRRIGAWLALLPLASAFMAPALPALPSCASPRAREPAFARLHNRIQHQPRMGLLEDMRAANAERMAINEGKNLVGSKYGVKTLQAFPCRVLKEDWKAQKLSAAELPCAQACRKCRTVSPHALILSFLKMHVCLRTLFLFLAGKRGSGDATGAMQGDLRGIAFIHQRRQRKEQGCRYRGAPQL